MLLRNLPFVLVALVLSALPAYSQGGGPASVFVEPVQERSFAMRIEALGTLEPNEQVDLTLNAADRVRAIYFDDGDRVKQGKTLLSLAQREQAALVEAAEATLDEARRQQERLARLADQQAVSQSELDQANRNLDSAAAQLRAVQSRQRDRVLVAPFDGVLGFRMVSVGSYVKPGDVVARLIDDSEMNLDFSVPSTYLRTLAKGTAIEARTDDLPREIFTGTVASIDNAIDPVTRSVRVRATLPNPDRVLISGMFVQVTLVADPRQALSVPEEAIQPVGPRTFVFVVEAEGDQLVARRKEVTLGLRQEGHVEVLSGLMAGENVITEGIIRVREGAAVEVRDQSMLLPKAVSGKNGSGGTAGSAASSGR
ncbi:efflux RND transporter periplasmic adaptor subunit [Hyphomonas sp.]|jgi:membrane fusion protein (multidrug efflux system)|uniref:efflux RND transporter periplasmic adaptor subunit n=1 Tax=Hyphomonas sp. TaxID=87 RepID=UPI0032D8DC3C